MGPFTKLSAADGFMFPACVARPSGQSRGGLEVLQENFGVNARKSAVAALPPPGVMPDIRASNHGFGGDQRGARDAPAAALAREGTPACLARHLG